VRWRVLMIVLAAAVITATGPSPAHAGIVVIAGQRLVFMASSGESNQVVVARSGSNIVVTDLGPPSLMGPGAPCTAPNPQAVSCPAAGMTALELSGGNLDDRLTNETQLPAQAYGEDGPDILRGGSADERLEGGPGPDDVDGGGGSDRLYGATLQDPGAGTDSDVLAGGFGNDGLFGSGGGDHLDGGPDADQLEGAGGADELRGSDGPDGLIGGDGDDLEDGGTGDDTVGTEVTLGVVETSQERGNDVLVGGAGNDTLIPGPGPPFPDADSINGGDGSDAVSYGPRMAPVNVSKDGTADDGGMAEGDNVGLDVERIVGGLVSDTLRGGLGPDVLEGGPGDDTVEGLAGDDTLLGDAGSGAGTDRVIGGPGVDLLHGEGGGDWLSGEEGNDIVQGGDGADTLRGGPDSDQLVGGGERDVVAYPSEANVTVRLDRNRGQSSQPGDQDTITEVENVSGGGQSDTFTGSNEANTLDGAVGEDYVDGLLGVDVLDGGDNADVVASRDRSRDEPVSCGPGPDLAIVDRRDPVVRRGVNRCEQIDDGTQTKPKPGRVYVEPQRCGGPEEDVGLRLPAMHRLVPLRYHIMLKSGYRRRAAPTLDAADCPVSLTATPGRGRSASATVSEGAVDVDQTSGRRVATVLTVERPSCGGAARSAGAAARQRGLRVNTGRRRGRWRVRGRYSIGASLGTDWITVERCRSTTTIVRRGRVRVRDLVKRRPVTVRAGHAYVSQKGVRPSD
jgi:Ca2+-binding RTX toxin-like protein